MLLTFGSHCSLSLAELVAQMIETHRNGRLAGPCVHALASAHQLGSLTHAEVKFVLLCFT